MSIAVDIHAAHEALPARYNFSAVPRVGEIIRIYVDRKRADLRVAKVSHLPSYGGMGDPSVSVICEVLP